MGQFLLTRGQLVAPGPVIPMLATSTAHRVVVSWFKLATLVEFEDALFRDGSAVVLPGGQRPDDAGAPGQVRTTAGLVATVLRRAEEHPSVRVLVAGHTDTVGPAAYNQILSQQRARAVSAVLLGDRDAFLRVATAPDWRSPTDAEHILQWAARFFRWDCDPGKVDGLHDARTVAATRAFQQSFNRESLGPRIPENGVIGHQTWGAFFDCYEAQLGVALGETRARVSALRKGLRFLRSEPWVGCGEHHPREAENRNEYSSQTNRRVEVLFFEPDEEPGLATCHPGPACVPGKCELYDSKRFRRRIVPPMLSALPWIATWESPRVHEGQRRRMQLDAPGLPAGHDMTFEVLQEGYGTIGEVHATSADGRVEAIWDDWYHPASVHWQGELEVGQPFPEIRFSFVVTGAGRRIEARAPIVYGDTIDLGLELEGDHELAHQPYLLLSPWAMRRGHLTTEDARVVAEGLPPGGVSVVLERSALVHLGKLDHGWKGQRPL